LTCYPILRRAPLTTLLPYTTLFRSRYAIAGIIIVIALVVAHKWLPGGKRRFSEIAPGIIVTLVLWLASGILFGRYLAEFANNYRSEEHTSELQSRVDLVCRLLLEKK